VDRVRATPPDKLASWGNKLTLRSLELYRSYEPGAFVTHISPTPLLLITMDNDSTTPTDEILGACNRALEPKRLLILSGGHCDLYARNREDAVGAALTFYREFLRGLHSGGAAARFRKTALAPQTHIYKPTYNVTLTVISGR
jgi:hypothetical protein